MPIRSIATLALLCGFFPSGALAQSWRAQGEGSAVVAGSLIEGELAGLRFSCTPQGVETRLTHNGATFDRQREHSVVLSVDGAARVLSMRAVPGQAGDDFVRRDAAEAAVPLLRALAAGREVEVSAPSGRYSLPLAGSARALSALEAGCAL
ncbi:hypothetical protein [Aureimonas populi]|uniref:Uncharacterized protein n=1 Tax=Aureimonas populi TaxID=1701758 RepID=A0ABW5CS17_9HYPH|nr:hypothetical protein [Aureimonas populi]